MNNVLLKLKDGKTLKIVWVVECSRDKLKAVIIGEGSIGGVQVIDRDDILEPKYFSTH